MTRQGKTAQEIREAILRGEFAKVAIQ